jgi:serine O-acetyltransferase
MNKITKGIRADLRATAERDPACRGFAEAVLCYPGWKALAAHRLAHRLWDAGWFIAARMLSQASRFFTGIEIHPAAKIGDGVFIDHGMGLVIGETAEVGDGVTLFHGVTLGGTGKGHGKRHPTVGAGAVIGAHAQLLGPITVGANAKVGANAVVLEDVPDGATAVGMPPHFRVIPAAQA